MREGDTPTLYFKSKEAIVGWVVPSGVWGHSEFRPASQLSNHPSERLTDTAHSAKKRQF